MAQERGLFNRLFGESEEDEVRRLRDERSQRGNTLLGQGVQTTGSFQGTDVFDEQGSPVFGQSTMQQPRFEGQGFLGSNRSAGDISGLNLGLINAGYSPQEAQQVAAPFKEQNKAVAGQRAEFKKAENAMRAESVKQGNVLRKERGQELAPFNEARTQYNTTMNALQQDSGAGTLAAIFSFMKTLDPRSVVREGEFQMGTQTGGVVDSLVGMVNRAKGKGMGPEARQGIAEAIQAIMEGRVADAEGIAERFDIIATEQGVPLSQIRTGAYNPELQGVPEAFIDQSDDRYEFRKNPKTGKMQRRLK